eukprot:gnl/MRDRNA2_/MRDRNA2_34384_c0_seq2.p1 gnl/MRDRNA2_/MRDRNA2_34384_c0~~gnl/MRDRNA2_/MRDRNA2_34384_c0_seq2.p1  ORF type:complete len:224 (-),score=60.85 gnl/MRDRNA2_/MRDRNA2_34384_c0_seq2:115-717(-)
MSEASATVDSSLEASSMAELNVNAMSEAEITAMSQAQLEQVHQMHQQAFAKAASRVDMSEYNFRNSAFFQAMQEAEAIETAQVAGAESVAGSYDRSLIPVTDAMLLSLMSHIALSTEKDARKPNISQEEFEKEARKHTRSWLDIHPEMQASATLFKAKMSMNPMFVQKCKTLDWNKEWTTTMDDEKKRGQCLMWKMLEDQ